MPPPPFFGVVPQQLQDIELPIEIGLGTWIGITAASAIYLGYLYFIDAKQCLAHAKMARGSKTVAALRLLAALAILCVYVSGGNHQGFVCHETVFPDDPMQQVPAELTCAGGAGAWVFPHRFWGYAVAIAAVNYILGLFIWSDSNNRLWLSLFGAAFWLVSGVFGTYTGYENHHWWYFYLGFFALTPWLLLSIFTRRRRGFNVTIVKAVYCLLHIAAAIIWIFSPAGYRDEYLGTRVTHWFYLAFDIIAYALLPFFISIMHIPRRFAVMYADGDAEEAYRHAAYPKSERKLIDSYALCARKCPKHDMCTPAPNRGKTSSRNQDDSSESDDGLY